MLYKRINELEDRWIKKKKKKKKKYVDEAYLPEEYVKKLDEVLSIVTAVVKDDATKIMLFGSSATGSLV